MTAPPEAKLPPRLARLRARARLVLWVELVWPAIWPALGVAGAFLCAALLGLPLALPGLARLGLLIAMAVLILALLWRGLARLSAPGPAAADRRLERDSGLAHRPLAVLQDRPVGVQGVALWQAHRARALAMLPRLKLGLPHPGLARHDRRALRLALVVALVAAFVIAGPNAPERLRAAMLPPLPHLPGAPPAQLQAWLTPPAYTHQPPVFLHPGQAAVRVPSGSRFSASLTGGSGGVPALALGKVRAPFATLAPGSYRAERILTLGPPQTAAQHLAVQRGGATLAAWDVTLVADTPPHVSWAATPGPDLAHGGQAVRLPWQASDDYGLAHLRVELRLRARLDAPPIILPIPLPEEAPHSAHGIAIRDLTDNPWAGLPVAAQLVATDASGLAGTSLPAMFVLPERVFHNKVARALVAIRKGLSVNPDDRDTAVGGLDALLIDPAAFGADFGAYLNTSAIYYELEFNHAKGAIAEAQARLWRLALHMEDGSAARSEAALEAARQAMREALDKAVAQPSQANRAALAAKLQALEAAIAQHLQALLAQQAQRDGAAAPMPRAQAAMTLRASDLDRLAQEAQQAARAGNMAQAEQQVQALERLLDRLRNARPGQMDPDQAAAQQRLRQALNTLRALIRGEGTVLDHAQARQQAQDADPAGAGQGRAADTLMQRMLRQALGGMAQQMADANTAIPESMAAAEAAMTGALDALGQGRDAATGQQALRAIQALQGSAQRMAKAGGMSIQGGQDGSSGQGDAADAPEGGDDAGWGDMPGSPGPHDPLGRSVGNGHGGAADDAADTVLPDAPGQARLRAIEDELRRRGAERTRPREELQYIDRLLKGL